MTDSDETPTPSEMAEQAARPARVLVVEDDGNTRRVLLLLLELRGYDATGTDHPAEGLELAGKEAFDLVISDLQLPEMSGIELASRLVERDGRLAMVAITSGSERLIRRARESGHFVTVLRKPIDVNELLDLAARLVPPP